MNEEHQKDKIEHDQGRFSQIFGLRSFMGVGDFDPNDDDLQFTEIQSSYTCTIRDGRFCQGSQTFSTAFGRTHDLDGYQAFVIDKHKQLKIFNHNDGSGLKHSSFVEEEQLVLREGFSFDDYVAKYCYFAGEIQVEDGYITRLTGYSGHFEPGIYNMAQAIMVLAELGADLSNLKRFYILEHP